MGPANSTAHQQKHAAHAYSVVAGGESDEVPLVVARHAKFENTLGSYQKAL